MAVTAESIQRFVSDKKIAVVGASATGKGFGSYAYAELKKRGYRVMAVHPTASAVHGDSCWRDFASLPEPVERALVSVSPEATEAVLRDAAAAGVRRVWLQQGAESPAAIRAAEDLGLDVVYGHCILMFAEPLGVHGIHRWIWKLIGKIPQ
jgi:uncharacterized protein